MNKWRNEDRIRYLLKLLANPLTIRVLYLLVGVDPGRISKEVLMEMVDDSWGSPTDDTRNHTDIGIS